MSVLIALILTVNVLLLAILSYFLYSIFNVYRTIKAFLTPTEKDKPSPVALVWESACSMLSRALMAGLRMTFLNKASADSRAASAIDSAIIQDSTDAANPIAGAILNRFPSLKKTLTRNPGLLDMAISRLGLFGSKGSPGAASGNHNDNVFKL
jgi:hypothetical protein